MALLNKIPRESQENMGYIQEGGFISNPLAKPFILNGKGVAKHANQEEKRTECKANVLIVF